MNQHTNFPASATQTSISRRRAILPKHKWYLVKALDAIKRTFDGSFFLDENHRKSLEPVSRKRLLSGELKEFEVNYPVRPYPAGMQPRLTLNTIESRLKGNQYESVEGFRTEFERLVNHSKAKWDDKKLGDEHVIIQASKKVLSDIEKAIRNMPTSAPTVSQAGQKAAAPTVDQNSTIATIEISNLIVKIANVRKMHEKTRLLPCDSQQPMFELDKLGRDTQQRCYKSYKEIYDALEQTSDKSEERNGPRHRITLLIYDVLTYVKNLLPPEYSEITIPASELALDDLDLDLDCERLALERLVVLSTSQRKRMKQITHVKRQAEDLRSGNKSSGTTKAPHNLVKDKIEERKREHEKLKGVSVKNDNDSEDKYTKFLRELSKDMPTRQQIVALDQARSGPIFLGRTASQTHGLKFGRHNRSNGYTAQDILLPAALTHPGDEYALHKDISGMTQGEIIYMCGKHLIWDDLRGDELLSFSQDPLFLVVHALGRYHGGEGNVTIQFFNRNKAKTSNGGLANFHSALDIFTIFEVPRWEGWETPQKKALQPRKFTQEYLTHGPISYSDPIMKQARIEDIIKDGLYDIFQGFYVSDDIERAGLYTSQVVYRMGGYPAKDLMPKQIYSYEDCSRSIPMTVELLGVVRKVTLNFRHVADEKRDEPPLHAFICFLTFEKRERADPVFVSWIKKHYTAQDVLELYADLDGSPAPGMTATADNLPGYKQYLDLLRDCIAVFGLTSLPPNDIKTAHPFDGTMDRSYKYATYDHFHHRDDEKFKKRTRPPKKKANPELGAEQAVDDSQEDA